MLEESRSIARQLSVLRREIHKHPELGFEEVRTASIVAEALKALGARVRTGIGKTGVLAELGPETGRIIALRADMDALPLQEEGNAEYASLEAGKMHACGHDAHTACLIGAAMLLAKRNLDVRIRFLFQPSEEREDEEGLGGAQRMIEEGALEGVSALLSLHVDGTLETGQIGLESGFVSSAVDTFKVRILGEGGHGAHPDQTVDPIWIASQVLSVLYAIPSRRIDPLAHCVLSIGVLRGGDAPNIIPAVVCLEGTLRSFDGDTRERLIDELERALGLSRALGGDFELDLIRGCPPMLNDVRLTMLVSEVVTELLGKNAVSGPSLSMGSDDFAYMTAGIPGTMFRLGVMPPGGRSKRVHSPDFDIDEAALPIGTAILAESAIRIARDPLWSAP